jgi:hypothetical protein
MMPTVTELLTDMCKMPMLDMDAKWTISTKKASRVHRAIINGIPNGKLAVAVLQKIACGLRYSGLHSYAEAVEGNVALAIWRDDDLAFHSVILVKEEGQWKTDFDAFL